MCKTGDLCLCASITSRISPLVCLGCYDRNPNIRNERDGPRETQCMLCTVFNCYCTENTARTKLSMQTSFSKVHYSLGGYVWPLSSMSRTGAFTRGMSLLSITNSQRPITLSFYSVFYFISKNRLYSNVP